MNTYDALSRGNKNMGSPSQAYHFTHARISPVTLLATLYMIQNPCWQECTSEAYDSNCQDLFHGCNV